MRKKTLPWIPWCVRFEALSAPCARESAVRELLLTPAAASLAMAETENTLASSHHSSKKEKQRLAPRSKMNPASQLHVNRQAKAPASTAVHVCIVRDFQGKCSVSRIPNVSFDLRLDQTTQQSTPRPFDGLFRGMLLSHSWM